MVYSLDSPPVIISIWPTQTVLVGEVADQGVLVGIVHAAYNSGRTVASVERLIPDTDLPMDDTMDVT
jgi:hypothetical protein